MKSLLNKINYARILFFRLFGDYKPQIAIIIFSGILSGILAGLGIGALVPLISFSLNRGSGLGNDMVSVAFERFFMFIGIDLSLISLLTIISIIFILKAIMVFIFNYITARISSDCENDYRRYFYNLTFKSSWAYLSNHELGKLEYMLGAHVESVPRLMHMLSAIFLNVTTFTIYLVMAFNISRITTTLAFFAGVVLLILSRPFIQRTKALTRRQAEIMNTVAHEVNENVTGLKTIKAMSVESASNKFAEGLFDDLRNVKIKSYIVKKVNQISIEPVSVVSIAIIFSIMYSRPAFDFGIFTVLLYLIQKIFLYVEDFQGSFHSLSSTLTYVGRLIDFENDVLKNQEIDAGKKDFRFEKQLAFENVSFSYFKRNNIAIDDVSFSVKKGEMLGIIGPSGAGKTTMVDLMLRLLLPSGGRITLDGVDAQEFKLGEWRKNVGYVSQDIFLKNDTIYNNIRFYDESITKDAVIEAARSAFIYDFIMTLPSGFDTVIGDRGMRLSGGERQRIVLARIFARKPKLLILDEATSSLDNESEQKIKSAIQKIKGDITIIAIAHRLSTVVSADRLIVLEQGKIIEEGAPEKLLSDKDSYFYKVYNIIDNDVIAEKSH